METSNPTSPAYTKAPWILKSIDGDARIVATDDMSVTSISVITTALSHLQPSILEANARLIAAAPELLDACRAAVSALDQIPNRKLSPVVGGIHKTTYSVCSMLDAAIEKAVGSALCVKCGKYPRDTAHGNDWCEHCIADLPF